MYEKSTLNLLLSPPPFTRLPIPYAAHDGQGKWSTVSSVIVLINYLDIIQKKVCINRYHTGQSWMTIDLPL
jgi:hypothetical protein